MPFLPATLAPTALQPKRRDQQSIEINPNCTDQLTYISDVTIPDIPSSPPPQHGQALGGEIADLQLGFGLQNKVIAGPTWVLSTGQELFRSRQWQPGNNTFPIYLFAPTAPGKYASAWQAFNPQGQPFEICFTLRRHKVAPTLKMGMIELDLNTLQFPTKRSRSNFMD